MLVYISCLYMLSAYGVFAAPIANSTALHHDIAPGWVSGPNTRGTWQILYSCIFTLVLCVYTAIHLNVPAKSDSALRFWLRKLKWVVIAIFAPEMVVYAAFEQWTLARNMLKKLKEIALDSKDEKFKKWYNRNGKHSPFDMSYAHYALMGGFVADVDDIHNKLERVTLSPQGILFLAENGYFCQLDPGEIEDKSKADYLAKGLVCVQVVWVVGQAIERKVANLPITLLEAHTIVHVVCALVMYALWYQKPLNVICPTVLNFGDDRDLLAFILQTSAPAHSYPLHALSPAPLPNKYSADLTSSFQAINSGFLKYSTAGTAENFEPQIYFCKSECVIANPFTSTSSAYDVSKHSIGPGDILKPITETVVKFVPSKGETRCTLRSGECLKSNIGFFYHNNPYEATKTFQTCEVSLTSKDVERLVLVGRACQRLEPVMIKNKRPHLDGPDQHLITFDREMNMYLEVNHPLEYRSPNVSFSILSDAVFSPKIFLWIALAIIPAAYGGVHLTALGFFFSTTVEKLLWKISCYYLLAAAGVICIYFGLKAVHFRYFFFFYRDELANLRKKLRNALSYAIDLAELGVIGLFALAILVYVAARIFLVVESFISLRHVPLGVYQMPDLDIMGNIPHL